MTDKNKKVVNTEEQNRPVNPGDRLAEDTQPSKKGLETDDDTSRASSAPGDKEVERTHRTEGDEEAGIDRTIPKL